MAGTAGLAGENPRVSQEGAVDDRDQELQFVEGEIDGVEIRPLKFYHDNRGWLAETFRQVIAGGQEVFYRGNLGKRIVAAETLDEMTAGYEVSSGIRGLGWDKQTGYSSNKGEGFSDRAFGHGGFTGTTFWVDPELDLFVIFLSNRLHPDGQGTVNKLAGRIGTIVVDAIER